MLPPKKKYPIEAESQPLGTQITYRPFENAPAPPVDPSIDTNDDQRMLKQHNPNLPQPLDKQYQPGYDPAKPAYENASDEYNAAAAAPIEKQPLWKQALFVGLQAVKNVAMNQDQPIQLLGNARHDYKVGQAGRKLEPLQKQRKFEMDRQLEQARINDIPYDNETKRIELESRRQDAVGRLQDRALSELRRSKKFDSKNPADRQAAERAGIDPDSIPSFDNSRPFIKTINGVTYEYKNGAFVPSGLPNEETVDYEIDGEKFKIPVKDAAKLKTQMKTFGIKMEESQRQFNQKMGLAREKFNQAKSQFEITMNARNRAQSAGDAKAAEQYDRQLQSMKQALETHKDDLSEDQYNELLKFYNH